MTSLELIRLNLPVLAAGLAQTLRIAFVTLAASVVKNAVIPASRGTPVPWRCAGPCAATWNCCAPCRWW